LNFFTDILTKIQNSFNRFSETSFQKAEETQISPLKKKTMNSSKDEEKKILNFSFFLEEIHLKKNSVIFRRIKEENQFYKEIFEFLAHWKKSLL